MNDNPYQPPQSQIQSPSPERRHSGLGVASFVMVIASVALEFGSIAAIGIFGDFTNKTPNTLEAVLVVILFGGFFLNLVAVAIGCSCAIPSEIG